MCIFIHYRMNVYTFSTIMFWSCAWPGQTSKHGAAVLAPLA